MQKHISYRHQWMEITGIQYMKLQTARVEKKKLYLMQQHVDM